MTGTDTTKALADRLTDLIKDSGKEHREIAKDCGIGSHGSLSKYASDGAEPGINTLVKLAKYFNVSIDYLAGLSDVKSPNTDLQGAVKLTMLTEEAIFKLRNFCIEDHSFGAARASVARHFISWSLSQVEYNNAVADIANAVALETLAPLAGDLYKLSRQFDLEYTNTGRAKLLRLSASHQLQQLVDRYTPPTALSQAFWDEEKNMHPNEDEEKRYVEWLEQTMQDEVD